MSHPEFDRIVEVGACDFRSLRGENGIETDAEIVLVFGENGAGKTSLLSAIEMALTGKIRSWWALPEAERGALVADGASEASARVAVARYRTKPNRAEANVRIDIAGKVSGASMLSGRAADTFSESALLEQGQISRIIDQISSGDSAGSELLSQIIDERVGAARLRYIAEGLNLARDFRHVKRQSPEVRALDGRLQSARAQVRDLVKAAVRAETQVAAATSDIRRQMDAFGKEPAEAPAALLAQSSTLEFGAEIGELDRVVNAARAQVKELRRAEGRAQADRAAPAQQVTRDAVAQARAAVLEWWEGPGAALLALHRLALSDEKSRSTPEARKSLSPAQVLHDCRRWARGLHEGEWPGNSNRQKSRARLAEAKSDVVIARARLEQARAQLSSQNGPAEIEESVAFLREAQARLHEPEVCPVCERDFREVAQESGDSLSTVLSTRIAAVITRLAGSLEIREAVDEAERHLRLSEARLEGLSESTVTHGALRSTVSRIAPSRPRMLAELERLEGVVAVGAELYEQFIELDGREKYRLSSLNESQRRAQLLKQTEEDFGVNLTAWGEESGSFAAAASALSLWVKHSEARLGAGRAVQETSRQLRMAMGVEGETRNQLRSARAEVERVELDLAEAKTRVRYAREILDAAQSGATQATGRGLADGLGRVWTEYFRRLAPQEVFAPTFEVESPRKGESRVVARFVHESGSASGPAGNILSAGNLSAATISFFLATHASASSPVPVMLMDDPIQSMDEMHISNFAAFVRTFARLGSTQVFLTIHDRALFDFLKVELGPSRPGERLAIVELSGGATARVGSRSRVVQFESDAVRAYPSVRRSGPH